MKTCIHMKLVIVSLIPDKFLAVNANLLVKWSESLRSNFWENIKFAISGRVKPRHHLPNFV